MGDVVKYHLATSMNPGAIAVVVLHGANAGGVREVIEKLTGKGVRQTCYVAPLGEIDEALIARLRDDWWEIMPHGGARVIQRVTERLEELGVQREEVAGGADVRVMYPEARNALEADMLATLAFATSGGAVDVLLDQPRRWEAALAKGKIDWPQVLQASQALDYLVKAPRVALVGRANVGKSTLTNLVMGKSASIVADMPGTTRDWVSGLAELEWVEGAGGLAVRWFDTPGIRQSDDGLEQRAIGLARGVIADADVVVAVRDGESGWPDLGEAKADIRVVNKVDKAGQAQVGGDEIGICALDGQGVQAMTDAIVRVLGLNDAVLGGLWAFSDELKAIAKRQDAQGLLGYLAR